VVIILQSDLGTVANADAYIDAAAFKAYHTARGNDVFGVTDVDIEQAIVKASDYVDTRFKYIGRKLAADQATEWPRGDVVDCDGRPVTGIPVPVKEAVAEYAFRIALGGVTLMPDPTVDATGQRVKRKRAKVDVIEEEVEFTGAGHELPRYPVADRKLIGACLVKAPGTVVRR